MRITDAQPKTEYSTCSHCGENKPRYRAQYNSRVCRECHNARAAEYQRRRRAEDPAHREKCRARDRKRRPLRAESHLLYKREWREKNREKCRNYQRKYADKIRASSDHRVKLAVRASVRSAIKRGGGKKWRKTEHFLGYPIARIVEWARENAYNPPHNEIDHIVPFAVWRKRYPDDIVKQQRAAWNLANLQVIPRGENRRKAAKLVTLV